MGLENMAENTAAGNRRALPKSRTCFGSSAVEAPLRPGDEPLGAEPWHRHVEHPIGEGDAVRSGWIDGRMSKQVRD